MLMKEARSSIQSYLDTVQTAHVAPTEKAPPFPSLERIRKKGCLSVQIKCLRKR